MNYLIKKCNGKPSSVLQAMVDGLLESQNDLSFKVDINTFGYVGIEACYGCAATCAIAKLKKVSPSHWVLNRYDPYDYSDLSDETSDLEAAVDSARSGSLEELFSLCDVSTFEKKSLLKFMYYWEDIICLTSSNWQDQLPLVQRLVNELRELGY